MNGLGEKEKKIIVEFGDSLMPAELKNWRSWLKVLVRLDKMEKTTGKVNVEYLKIYKKCSATICNVPDAMLKYNSPFEKICHEYDAMNVEIWKNFKDWEANKKNNRDILSHILKKDKREKVMKRINMQLQDSTKQLSQLEKYHGQVSNMLVKMKEFEKRLAVFIN